jgi:MFS family permease
MMVCFGLGGIAMGRLADRIGIQKVLWLGSVGIVLGFLAAGMAPNIWLFIVAHGLLLGLLGSSTTFAPLLADTSLWWDKRRGVAVAVCASGNYLAGSIWPTLTQWGVEQWGWRSAYIVLGLVCGLGMAALAFGMRQRPPLLGPTVVSASGQSLTSERPFGMSVGAAQAWLFLAGLSCCVAMAMPSRLVSGAICDRIGGMRTLMLGSALQGIALLMFIPFDGLVSLYVISALFGLFQGGIVPSYAIIVREYFPPAQAGQRVGAVIMATMLGMALGGWMSGMVYDLTGSYRAAFINGAAWNLLNGAIAWVLFMRVRALQRPVHT